MRINLKTVAGFLQRILIYFQGIINVNVTYGQTNWEKNVISKDPLSFAWNLKSISKMKRPLACERPFCL